MARAPEISLDHLNQKQKKVYSQISSGPRGGVRGPFIPLLSSPELADKVQKLGQFVRYECSIPWKLREIAILITAHHWKAQYEWYAHNSEALKAGVSKGIIEAIRIGIKPDFEEEDEAEIYNFCMELYGTKQIKEKTFKKVLDRHGQEGVTDLAGLLGHYNLIAITLNIFDIEVPEGSKPFQV